MAEKLNCSAAFAGMITKAVDAMKVVNMEYENCLQVLEDLTSPTRKDGLTIDKLKKVLTVASNRARDKQRRTREVEKYMWGKVQVILDPSGNSSKLPLKGRPKLRAPPKAEVTVKPDSVVGEASISKAIGRPKKGRKRKANTQGSEVISKRQSSRNLTVPSSSLETMSNSSYFSRSADDFKVNAARAKKRFKSRKSNSSTEVSQMNSTDGRKNRSHSEKLKSTDAGKFQDGHSSKTFAIFDAWKLKQSDADKIKKDDFKVVKARVNSPKIEVASTAEAIEDSYPGPLKEVQRVMRGNKTRGWKRRNAQDAEAASSLDQDIDEELDEPKYCVCNEMSYGDMIACDNDLCPMEWFHFKCVQLTSKPRGKWYCPRCRGDRPNVMKPREVIIQELEQYNREKED